MGESILVAVITGGLSLVGVVFTSMMSTRKTEQAQAVAQAVTETKIDNLTQEVRQHNGFAQKIPLLQAECDNLKRRVSDLEQYHKQPN
jgi:polyhydroxyalkanoate synthesis regulator phasin